MKTNQSPSGGGGFPPPWIHNSVQSSGDGVEWGDPLPRMDSDSESQNPLHSSLAPEGSPKDGDWESVPHPEEQGHYGERFDHEARSMEEPHHSGFDSILNTFSAAADTDSTHRSRGQKKAKQGGTRRTTLRAPVPMKKALTPIAILLSLGTLAGLGFLGYNVLGADEGTQKASETPEEVEVSRDAPPGWSKTAAWTSPADVASNLAVRNNYIGYLNSSGVLVVMDGKSGDTVFSSTPTGADPDESRVVITQIEDTPVAVVVQRTSLTAWALDQDAPEATVNDIPSSASVSSGSSGVMMSTNGETWKMTSSLGMEKVEGLPDGNTSLGMNEDGSIISGSPKGGWSINDGKKSTEVKVEMAEGAKGKVMYPTRASKGIVVAWAPTSDKNTRVVGVYNSDNGSLIATTTMDTAQVNLGLPLTVTDGGKLASAGSWLIDLERGETEVVEGWSTIISTTTELYGKTSEGKFLWRGSGKPDAVADGAATPWGISADRAIIIAKSNGEKVIAALNRE